MSWLSAVQRLRVDRRPGVLVTVTTVRGHAPREAGAKLVVAQGECWGTVGGGNLEEVALNRARQMIADRETVPDTLTVRLNDQARNRYGRQCCGGEVTLLLEPLPVMPSVAIFGLGHVGLELARILARHDLELHLIDSRPEQVAPQRLALLGDAVADLHPHLAVVPELVLGEVPSGTHVLIMTHDHAEDFALCDAALRCAHLGAVGLIGSAVKWKRFVRNLLAEGHAPERVESINSPIGLPELTGKDPAVIAVGVAAQLLAALQGEREMASAATSSTVQRDSGRMA